MKKTIVLIGLILSIQGAQAACPIYLRAYVQVVNEQGDIIPDAELYRFLYKNDSSELSSRRYRPSTFPDNYVPGKDRYQDLFLDSNTKQVWSMGLIFFDEEAEYAEFRYKVFAPGYTTACIKDFRGTLSKRDSVYSYRKAPLLKVVLYSKNKLIKHNDKYVTFDKIEYHQAFVFQDSAVLDYQVFKGQLSESDMNQYVEEQSRVRTFPNPARDKVNVSFGEAIKGDHWIEIMDAQGRTLRKEKLIDRNSTIGLHGLTQGTYCVVIQDPDGQLLLREWLVKL